MSLLSWPERILAGFLISVAYLKARLSERSTWASIGVGVTAAAALEAPWSFIFVGISTVAAMIPDGPVKPE